MIENFLQPVIEEYTQGGYFTQLQEAQEEFFAKTGKVNEDDPFFDERMALFLDWYMFDRKLNGENFPPIRHFYRKNRDKFSPENLIYYRGLANHIHSIFNLIKINKKDVRVTDMATNKNYSVNPGAMRLSLSEEDIFEGRIVPIGREWRFTTGFCFHPKEIKKFLLDEIKKTKSYENKVYKDLILELASMKLRLERYHHIGPEKIYQRHPEASIRHPQRAAEAPSRRRGGPGSPQPEEMPTPSLTAGHDVRHFRRNDSSRSQLRHPGKSRDKY